MSEAVEVECWATFTPGPWRVDPENNCDVQSADGTAEIATTHHNVLCNREPFRCKADAALIAAAPDLFEALRDGLEIWDVDFGDGVEAPYIVKARAALAKARGETAP